MDLHETDDIVLVDEDEEDTKVTFNVFKNDETGLWTVEHYLPHEETWELWFDDAKSRTAALRRYFLMLADFYKDGDE